MNWRYMAATVIGANHIKEGSECQDYHGVLQDIGSDILIAVVSDGAGSASMSSLGSRIICDTILAQARAHFNSESDQAIDRDTIADWIVSARTEMINKHEGSQLRDFACTMLLAIVSPVKAIFAQIGDGAIVQKSDENNQWECVFWPQKGMFANITMFVTDDDFRDNLLLAESMPPKALAMFSDGIENLVLEMATRTAFQPFFNRVVQPLHHSTASGLDENLTDKLANYLASETICNRTDDDKTLVIAVRQNTD